MYIYYYVEGMKIDVAAEYFPNTDVGAANAMEHIREWFAKNPATRIVIMDTPL
jgi:hypothetical protein